MSDLMAGAKPNETIRQLTMNSTLVYVLEELDYMLERRWHGTYILDNLNEQFIWRHFVLDSLEELKEWWHHNMENFRKKFNGAQ